MMRPNLKPRTWIRYERHVRLHIGPALGTVRLARLTAQQLQLLYARKLAEGLAPGSVQHLHAVLHHALDDATRLGLVQRNVADLVTAPRAERHEMKTLTPEQALAAVAAARGCAVPDTSQQREWVERYAARHQPA
jgi:integrase